MKKLSLATALFLLSFAALANSVYPNVYNNGRSVTLNAWNNSDQSIRCSGRIEMEMSDNTRDSVYVSELIWPRGTLNRTYYPTFSSVTISNISHSVYCW
jgi:hypothetical protein